MKPPIAQYHRPRGTIYYWLSALCRCGRLMEWQAISPMTSDTAREAGWVRDEGGRWWCPKCARERGLG